MELALALVVDPGVDPGVDHCTVRVLGEPVTRQAGYADPFRPRAGSLRPCWLVAVDTTGSPPVVVWRWFPATVLAVDEVGVRLEEPHHGEIEAPAVVPAPSVGEVVHVTTVLGGEGWRIDAPVDRPELARAALPDVVAFYRRMGWT